MSDNEDKKEVVHRDVGASLSIKSKRGSGTNDRDEVKGEVNGETVDKISEKSEQLQSIVERTMKQMRDVQPDED